jgi:monoamine oxidase
VHLNSPVSDIEEDRDGVRITHARGRVDCEEVVLAVPPSVWGRIRFAPALPEILRPQMGTNIKYLAAVSQRFWEREQISPYSLGDGPLAITWDGTRGQIGEMACLVGFSGAAAAEEARRLHRPGCRMALRARYPRLEEFFLRDRFMDWPGDRWTRAGYSFPAPGEVTAVGPILAHGRGRIHFAGEHASHAFVGYMEGALQSGAAVARRVAQAEMLTGAVTE